MLRGYFASVSLVICALLLCNNKDVAGMSMEQLKHAIKPMRNSCSANAGVAPAHFDGMANGEFPEDEASLCYAKCVMTALKSLNDGKPVLNALLKQIKFMPKNMQARSGEVAKYCCENIDYDDDPCVAAWQFVKCTYEKDPEIFIFP